MTDEEIWKMLFYGGRDGSIKMEYGSSMPESFYTTTGSAATTSFPTGGYLKEIQAALHELKKIEEDFKNRVDVIVMTTARLEEITDFMKKENARIRSPQPASANPFLDSLYGIKVETFETQELCVLHAKLMILTGKKVMLIEE